MAWTYYWSRQPTNGDPQSKSEKDQHHSRIDYARAPGKLQTDRKALPRGFKVPLLKRNAWQLANQTGVVDHFDLKLTTKLTSLYNHQALYQDKLDHISENWYIAGNISPNDFSNPTIAVGILTNNIVTQEKKLLEQYPKMIDRLQSYTT